MVCIHSIPKVPDPYSARVSNLSEHDDVPGSLSAVETSMSQCKVQGLKAALAFPGARTEAGAWGRVLEGGLCSENPLTQGFRSTRVRKVLGSQKRIRHSETTDSLNPKPPNCYLSSKRSVGGERSRTPQRAVEPLHCLVWRVWIFRFEVVGLRVWSLRV